MMSTENTSSSVSLEVETTLSYSLPTHVGQGELFDAFWRRVPTSLESQVYRITRIGDMRWRVGSSRRWSAATRRTLGGDRLAILRLMTSTMDDDSKSGIPSTVMSNVKLHLASSRCVRYEAAMCLRSNIAYPMLLEDRMSLEIRPDDALNGALLSSENDCSDNNMGLLFSHRLSFYAMVRFSSSSRNDHNGGNDVDDALAAATDARDDINDRCCCGGLEIECIELRDDCSLHARTEQEEYVRVSLRSSLNEYHEIAYSLELECERAVAISSLRWHENDGARCRRHDALSAVFVRYVEPWLCDYWPDGVRHETIRPTPPREILEDHRARTCLALTGASLYSYDRLWQRVAHAPMNALRRKRRQSVDGHTLTCATGHHCSGTTATAATSSTTMPSRTIKLKYDGVRDYGFFVSNRLNPIYGGEITRTHSVAQHDEHNRSLLSGLFVYQLETLESIEPNESTLRVACNDESKEPQQRRAIVRRPRRRYVITEVAFMLDHRALLGTYGGDVLSRPIEYNESVGTQEQRCVATGYLLNERGDDLWRASMTALFNDANEEANRCLDRQHASRESLMSLRCARLAGHFVEFLASSARWPTSYVANDVDTTTWPSTAHHLAASLGGEQSFMHNSLVCSMVAEAVRTHRIRFRTGGYDVCAMLLELYERAIAGDVDDSATQTSRAMPAVVMLRELLAVLNEHRIINGRCRRNSNDGKSSFTALDDKRVVTIGGGNGLERVLVALGIEYSNAVLTRMHVEWRVDDNPDNVLFVSEPYTSARGEERVRWANDALRRAREQDLPTDGFLDTVTITATHDRCHSDAIDPVARGVETAVSFSGYEKIKLRQSVELLVSWDRGILACRDRVYALRRNVADNRGNTAINATTTTSWRIIAATMNTAINIKRTTRRCRRHRRIKLRRLIVENLPPIFATTSTKIQNHGDDDCHHGCGSIGEFEHIAPGIVRFLRWRSDKNDPDSAAKAHRVIFNDYY